MADAEAEAAPTEAAPEAPKDEEPKAETDPAAPVEPPVESAAADPTVTDPAAPAETAAAAEGTAVDPAAEGAEMPAASVTVPVEKIVEVTAIPRPPVVYIEASQGQTRVVLLKDRGDRISVRDVGTSLDPLKDLGVGREDEEAAALLQRRSGFAEFLGSILKTAAEALDGCKNPEVVLGLSSWYTDLPDEDKASFEGVWDSLRQQARSNLAEDAVLVLLPLPEDEEARHEHRAVAFAATQVQRLKPDFGGLVLGISEASAKLRCTCGFAADSPVLWLPLSLEEGASMIEGGEEGLAQWQSQCKEKCTEIFTASKETIIGVCEKASVPQVCVLGGLLQGVSAPANLLGQQELKGALEKLQAALGDAASVTDKAAIVRSIAALEAVEGVAGSSLQVLVTEKWELGGSSFNASWSVGHYLKRPQGTKEVAQTDGPPPTPSEAGPAADATKPGEKEEPGAAATETDVATDRQATGDVAVEATTEEPEKPQVPEQPPVGTMDDFQPERETKVRSGPGFVVYIIAPNDDMPLTGADFSAIRAAAVHSDATVVLTARNASSLVVEEGKKVTESNRVLRPLADFAVRRFSPAGSSKAGAHHSAFQYLFEAIVLNGKEAVYRSVVEGLQNLGYPGDAAGTAEALLPVGVPKVTKQEFCSSLADAFVHPEMVVICPKNSKGSAEWPQVRSVHFPGTDMTGEAALKTKVAEAWKAAGHGGHGVILVLAARGRQSMAPADYERQMRQELQVAMQGLPTRWPLLWAPGPAEVGLFPIGCKQRSNWAMQQAYLSELPGWLRYLLVIRPTNT